MTAALEQELRWLRASTAEALKTRDRVIARLLDGWQAKTNGDHSGYPSPDGPVWRFDYHPATAGFPGPKFEPMSDGEAAIIRQHQERGQ